MNEDNPNRHHAYGPPIAAVVSPPILAPAPVAVIRCDKCHDVWTHGHEHRCPHGGQPPPGVTPAAPPAPWTPPKAPFQGDTKFEQEALAEARREWLGMSEEQMRFARGVHTIVRHAEGGFHLETVPLAVLTPTAEQTRAAGAAATIAKRDAARAAKENPEPPPAAPEPEVTKRHSERPTRESAHPAPVKGHSVRPTRESAHPAPVKGHSVRPKR